MKYWFEYKLSEHDRSVLDMTEEGRAVLAWMGECRRKLSILQRVRFGFSILMGGIVAGLMHFFFMDYEFTSLHYAFFGVVACSIVFLLLWQFKPLGQNPVIWQNLQKFKKSVRDTYMPSETSKVMRAMLSVQDAL